MACFGVLVGCVAACTLVCWSDLQVSAPPTSHPSLPFRPGEETKDWNADNHTHNTDRYRWDCQMADPTFVVLDNGTTIIGYRGTQCLWQEGKAFQEVGGLLIAPHWSGPFHRQGVKIFGEHGDNEDMWMWRSSRGVHMLMHSMRKDRGGNAHKKKRGGCDVRCLPGVHWQGTVHQCVHSFVRHRLFLDTPGMLSLSTVSSGICPWPRRTTTTCIGMTAVSQLSAKDSARLSCLTHSVVHRHTSSPVSPPQWTAFVGVTVGRPCSQ